MCEAVRVFVLQLNGGSMRGHRLLTMVMSDGMVMVMLILELGIEPQVIERVVGALNL